MQNLPVNVPVIKVNLPDTLEYRIDRGTPIVMFKDSPVDQERYENFKAAVRNKSRPPPHITPG